MGESIEKPAPTIRAATVKDANAIVKIYIDSWNLGFTGLLPQRTINGELVARWQRDLAKPLPKRWWVAELSGAIAGFAGIGSSRDPIDPELGELDTIAVDPSRWRCGIGRALMAEAIHHLIADGYREAVLWTLAGYERGKHFYETLGWRLDGRTRDEGRQVRYRHRLGRLRRPNDSQS
jgi:GNAT superfamily N-acetyltransferase